VTSPANIKYLTIADVAEACQASTRTVRRWVAARHLRVVRLGGLVRIRQEDFAAFAGQWKKTK
jgi:excisionase family DNA binding protein